MKRIEFGQLITILANVGVIAGIVFLAIELRQNNEYMAANAKYDMFQNQVAFLDQIASSPELSELVVRAMDSEELSRADHLRLQMLAIKSLRNWQWEFEEYQAGRLELGQLPVGQWRAIFNRQPGFISLPIDEIWDPGTIRQTNPAFAKFMEENVVSQ
jgi:hypothetical protein